MKHLRWSIAKNAASNIVRGGATAIVAVILPHYLAHDLRPDRFAAWSLMLQIAAYASFLDFGLQATVARSVAQALELEQGARARKMFGTAFGLLSAAALVALLSVAIVLLFAHTLFRGIPIGLLREFQIAAGVMTLGAALQLPFSAFSGVLIGMQRNDLPALAIGGSRLLGAAAAVAAVRYTDSLVVLAFCIVVPNLVGGLLQQVFVARLLPGSKVRRSLLDRNIARELVRYCIGLTVWSFSMLLISGLDVAIVGHFDFVSVGPYAIAATVTSIQASANSSIMNAFLAPFAAMHAQGNFDRVRRMVVRATRITTWFNVLLLAATAGFGIPVLRLWVGGYTMQTYPFLLTLMLSQTLRLCWTSYAVALMATNHQNECIIPAIVEGLVNLGVSLWAVLRFGAIGVAVGSVIGAIVAIPVLLIWTIYSRRDLPISRKDLIEGGVARGVASAIPVVIWALLVLFRPMTLGLSLSIWAAAIAGSVLMASKFVYPASKVRLA
jgi:O-antigen/teichoic acid export membrane protein